MNTLQNATSDNAVERLRLVEQRLARAIQDAGRVRDSVALVAVSKTFDAEVILPVIRAGQRIFGENRVQEAKRKWPELRAQTNGIELHLIGPLQSNKAEEAVELFDVIETVDRPKIVSALAAAMDKARRKPRFYLQVNTGAEPQKAGVLPQDLAELVALCGEHALSPEGLMCIPPAGEQASPHFALLAKLGARHDLKHLSMGMSADFECAIQLGATHVRLGSAIFGVRSPAHAEAISEG